jgi:hypothetical protein
MAWADDDWCGTNGRPPALMPNVRYFGFIPAAQPKLNSLEFKIRLLPHLNLVSRRRRFRGKEADWFDTDSVISDVCRTYYCKRSYL